jgi:hypothetical protein
VSRAKLERVFVPAAWWLLAAMAEPGVFGPPWGEPGRRLYTLLDRVALTGNLLTDVWTGRTTWSAARTSVSFGFTCPGTARFQQMTAAVATRGERDSRLAARCTSAL